MADGMISTAANGSLYRGVASIPSRRSLNVQLGPTATVHEDAEEDAQIERQPPLAGWTPSLEPLNPGGTQRATPRRRPQQLQRQPTQQLNLAAEPPQLAQQQQRLRWSRMSISTTAMSAPLSLTSVAIPTATDTSAGLCQLVDFGETRELIRRHREAAKKLAEVNSIVSHLSLEKENSQEPRAFIGWATFRRQPNSQFKQYVFQAPGRTPHLPETDVASAQQQQQQQQQQQRLQRSKTTLGLVAGRAAARHSRPEPLGAAFRRELTTIAAADLRRDGSGLGVQQQPSQSQLAHYKGQGHSSNATGAAGTTDGLYEQFERRKTRTSIHMD